MSDYDNGFRRAQQMYDAQEQPLDDEPEDDKHPDKPLQCPKCSSEMTKGGRYVDLPWWLDTGFECPNCGTEVYIRWREKSGVEEWHR